MQSVDQLKQALDSERLTLTELDDGSAVLLDRQAEALLTLNRSALEIIAAVRSGCLDEQALGGHLSRRFDIDGERAAEDVRLFIEQIARVL